MSEGTTALTLRRERSVVVVEALPALVCQDCGEALLSAEFSQAVYTLADREGSRGVALEFCTYAA